MSDNFTCTFPLDKTLVKIRSHPHPDVLTAGHSPPCSYSWHHNCYCYCCYDGGDCCNDSHDCCTTDATDSSNGRDGSADANGDGEDDGGGTTGARSSGWTGSVQRTAST